MIPYIPKKFIPLQRAIDVPTSWQGPSVILADILERFDVRRNFALEFGVEHGYSTAALANFFEHVIGVDHFQGDKDSGRKTMETHHAQAVSNLAGFPNVGILPWSYQRFVEQMDCRPDLIHIDIVHDYKSTYECGYWAALHSPIVLFHDTKSFPDVMQACEVIADETGCHFYNWDEPLGCNGLGILSKREAV